MSTGDFIFRCSILFHAFYHAVLSREVRVGAVFVFGTFILVTLNSLGFGALNEFRISFELKVSTFATVKFSKNKNKTTKKRLTLLTVIHYQRP